MESRVKLFGHPVHQMLVVFPLGLLATSVVFDIIHLASGAAYAATVAYALIASGIVGGLLAAPFGLIDWVAIPSGTRAKRGKGMRATTWRALRSRREPAVTRPPCAEAHREARRVAVVADEPSTAALRAEALVRALEGHET